jgi:hypothetical protein
MIVFFWHFGQRIAKWLETVVFEGFVVKNNFRIIIAAQVCH